MEKRGWKTLAIILICVITLFIFLGVWGAIEENKEIKKANICFYDICGGYPDAEYLASVCYCYDYDILGYLTLNKTEYMG